MTEDEITDSSLMDGITELNGLEFEQAPEVGDGQGSLACWNLWGHKKSDMIKRLK